MGNKTEMLEGGIVFLLEMVIPFRILPCLSLLVSGKLAFRNRGLVPFATQLLLRAQAGL